MCVFDYRWRCIWRKWHARKTVETSEICWSWSRNFVSWWNELFFMNKYFLFYFRQNTLFVWFIRVRFQGLVWNLVKVWSVVLKEKHIGWPKDHFHPRLKTPFKMAAVCWDLGQMKMKRWEQTSVSIWCINASTSTSTSLEPGAECLHPSLINNQYLFFLNDNVQRRKVVEALLEKCSTRYKSIINLK